MRQNRQFIILFMKIKIFITLLYIFWGIWIYLENISAFYIYVTILPIQLAFLNYALKSGRASMIVLFLIQFLAFGVNSVTFYLFKDTYASEGFNAIKKFDFSILNYYAIYSIMFVYSLGILLCTKLLFLMFPSKPTFPQVFHVIRLIKVSNVKTNRHTDTFLFFLVVLGVLLNIWMYTNQVGIVGMQTAKLPFHLSGILYYTRRYLITFFLIYLFFRCKNKWFCFFLLLIYAFISSVAGSSRSIAAFIVGGAFIDSVVNKSKSRMYISIFWGIALMMFVSVSRSILFQNSAISLGFSDFLFSSFDIFQEYEDNPFIAFIHTFSGRLFGAQSLVLSSQVHILNFEDLLKFYLGVPHQFIVTVDVPNYFYGINLPPDMAFGLGLGLSDYIILLSDGNYFLTLLQAFWMACFIVAIETISAKALYSKSSFLFNISFTFIGGFLIYLVHVGEDIFLLYIFIAIGYYLTKKKKMIVHRNSMV